MNENSVLLHPKVLRHGFCLKNGGKLIRPVVSLLGSVKMLMESVLQYKCEKHWHFKSNTHNLGLVKHTLATMLQVILNIILTIQYCNIYVQY